MEGHAAIQADCLAVDGLDTVACIGGDGQGDGLSLTVYSASRGEAVQHFRGEYAAWLASGLRVRHACQHYG